jgi:hypothetical protein
MAVRECSQMKPRPCFFKTGNGPQRISRRQSGAGSSTARDRDKCKYASPLGPSVPRCSRGPTPPSSGLCPGQHFRDERRAPGSRVHDEIDMTIRYEPGEANEASQLIFPKPNVVIRPDRGGAVHPPINVSDSTLKARSQLRDSRTAIRPVYGSRRDGLATRCGGELVACSDR